MSSLMKINFSESEDIRTPEKTKMSVVSLGGHTASKLEVAPGWKWSECIKPHVGTESCQKSHVGYIESDHLHVVSDDGSTVDVKAGDFYVCRPGHDAWVVGNESVIAYEFEGGWTGEFADK